MNEGEIPSPMQDQFIEKSAFDEDNDEDEMQAPVMASPSPYEESKNDGSRPKRSLSDVAAEKAGS